MSLNINIRALRQAKGMTLAELAGMIGVSTPHLSEVERGKKNLNNHLMERLASALGVGPEALVSGDLKQDAARLNAIVARLNDDDAARVVAFAEALALAEKGPQQN